MTTPPRLSDAWVQPNRTLTLPAYTWLRDLQAQVDGESVAQSFETVSSNLDASNASYAYSGGNLSTITYANGVVKTFAYSGGDLVSVTLSGATPDGITLTKTFTYSGGDLTAITYS